MKINFISTKQLYDAMPDGKKIDYLLECVRKGQTEKQIADELGIKVETIHHQLKKYGLFDLYQERQLPDTEQRPNTESYQECVAPKSQNHPPKKRKTCREYYTEAIEKGLTIEEMASERKINRTSVYITISACGLMEEYRQKHPVVRKKRAKKTEKADSRTEQIREIMKPGIIYIPLQSDSFLFLDLFFGYNDACGSHGINLFTKMVLPSLKKRYSDKEVMRIARNTTEKVASMKPEDVESYLLGLC